MNDHSAKTIQPTTKLEHWNIIKKASITLITCLALICTTQAEELILDKSKSRLQGSIIPGFFEVRRNPDNGNYHIFDARKITSIEVRNNESENITIYYDGIKYDKIIIPNRLMQGKRELEVIARAIASINNWSLDPVTSMRSIEGFEIPLSGIERGFAFEIAQARRARSPNQEKYHLNVRWT